MPLYLNSKICHIHIPKTGGTSIRSTMHSCGDEQLFYQGAHTINGHSPQHSTYRDLLEWQLIPRGFKIISVIRNPYSRFISEYNSQAMPDETPDQFAMALFHNIGKGTRIWGGHQEPMWHFLQDHQGKLPRDMILINFEKLEGEFQANTGIPLIHHMNKSTPRIQELDSRTKELVYKHWQIDFHKLSYDPYE